MSKALSAFLRTALQESLAAIDTRLRVTTGIESVLRAVEKEFSLSANYAKGHAERSLGRG